MMFPSNRVRVLVSTQPVDFRKGHGGLASIVSSVLRKDPFTGTVFVVRSRRADRLKLLYWDGTGLVPLGTLLRNALPGSGWLINGWKKRPSPGRRSRTG